MPVVILDRDGVINEDSDAYIKSVDEWIPIPGSIEAISKLYKAGFTIVVATNQSGLGRQLFKLDDLEAMHNKLNTLVENAGGKIAGIYYCPHHPEDGCACRKPKAGLIEAMERELNVSAQGAFFIGDSMRDLEAGLVKGCTPILVKTGKGEKTLAKINAGDNIVFSGLTTYADLAEAADALVKTL
jgi:D-glycero-D-manno-heptose 1,7-bisphosphate phosphatase